MLAPIGLIYYLKFSNCSLNWGFIFKNIRTTKRYLSTTLLNKTSHNIDYELFTPEYPVNENYLRNSQNQQRILDNIRAREVANDFPDLFEDNLSSDDLSERLIKVAKRLPNDHHPVWNNCEHKLNIIEYVGRKKEFDFKPLRAEDILVEMNLAYFSTPNLGLVGGPRSYMFYGPLAKLARALSRWTMSKLIHDYGFIPVVTPTMIYADFVRACGFEPFGPRTQVYNFQEKSNVCLTGTSEMPLASMYIGKKFPTENDLPKKYCALSRCYRAEAKTTGEMSGLYRVHYFDKVEMFALTEADCQKSDQMLDEFVSIEKTLFNDLGLHYRVVDMPPSELGPPAYRKFDIEAYMPGRDFWGEISSASNCTDYQSKRLNITYDKFYFDNSEAKNIIDVKENYIHTINGTACAIPRIIIAIVEQNQSQNHQFITIPEVLRPFFKCDRINMINISNNNKT